MRREEIGDATDAEGTEGEDTKGKESDAWARGGGGIHQKLGLEG